MGNRVDKSGSLGNVRGHSAWRLGLIGLLLPLALGSAAQTPLRWNNTGTATPPAPAATQPAHTVARSPVTAVHTMPLASGFDVRLFEAMAQRLVANQRVPGLAMALVQNGRVLSARGYGVTDTRVAEPVDGHTVFRLASLSKGFAGTMTGLLVSEGALRWDSKLSDYLPEFQLQDPYAAKRVTVADLLSHRVGLTHNTYDRDLEGNVDYRTLTQRLAYAPMNCQPGDCYAYQNIAFSLIGDVVFAATGDFYSQAVERRLFKPLGMNDASLGLEGIYASPRWARPHVRGRGGWVALTPKPTYYQLPPAAGVNASISDMAQWLIAQGGHRPDVLPAPLLATLHAPIVATPGEMRGSKWRRERVFSASYALGWRVYDYAGHQLVFHGGAVQGYRGLVAMLPERDLGIAILWNSESSLPSGLLPTILDRAIGLPDQRWLDIEPSDDLLYAERRIEDAGADASRGNASPK
ncbi:serine hydrolase domain-containing protein [Lysobacter sp. CFH 32150]|uniref:serine hydrolase domain-containing protein n=1 Tax=Lysobacter sp. CFH 32150 TaxID=2927128 RepID=UPI001FA7F356|nr:serine hydrolase domain-containing protein [Lysobacter sp. CFH 32150]MCI4568664.1 beta-lactamase family protein [Lysobacter sp. CFH 32150]